MRIAQVTPVYPPYRGGMGSIAQEYTEQLRALGHTVGVFTPRRFRFGNAGWMPSLAFVGSAFDVVHLHYPFFGGAEPLTLCPIRAHCPIVITYHMDAMADGLKGKIFESHRKLLQPFILDKAEKVLVSSLDYAQNSGLAPFLRKHPERVVEMPFGVDVEMSNPHSMTLDSTIPSAPILFVGGLDTAHAFKGVPVLLRAMREVPEAHLTIVGDGDIRHSYEALAVELGIADRVEFLGSVSQGVLAEIYGNALIHVLPSTSGAEAFGLVTLEAGSRGIPSIVSDLPGVRTLVRHGETGLVVPAGDPQALAEALRSLLHNPDLRVKMGLTARERVRKEYRWDVLMDRLVNVYVSML
ncbi:MAG: glycosyltransferase family 4 protein [Patescibacteria group bacterium]